MIDGIVLEGRDDDLPKLGECMWGVCGCFHIVLVYTSKCPSGIVRQRIPRYRPCVPTRRGICRPIRPNKARSNKFWTTTNTATTSPCSFHTKIPPSAIMEGPDQHPIKLPRVAMSVSTMNSCSSCSSLTAIGQNILYPMQMDAPSKLLRPRTVVDVRHQHWGNSSHSCDWGPLHSPFDL